MTQTSSRHTRPSSQELPGQQVSLRPPVRHCDGALDGESLVVRVGALDGAEVGALDGAEVGALDGAEVGALDGAKLGALDGIIDGASDGAKLGALDGIKDG